MIKDIFELQNPWRNNSDYVFNQKDRAILPVLLDQLDNNKIIGLIGSRQVGKSSLIFLIIRALIQKYSGSGNIYYFNLDDLKLQELFINIPEFIQFIGRDSEKKYIFIDEIQRLDNPGLFLKEVYDLGLNWKIFYSGSSQLEIRSKMKEHLVGRARQFVINRLSFEEYLQFNTPITRVQALEEILIYGAYPGIAIERDKMEKKLSIKDIFQSYIEKDITEFLKVENAQAFNRLLILLANQSGNLLNIDNLSKNLRISRKETEKYINILEQTFIIKRIYPFFKNYKKEITKTPKIFFLDSGLRNYILNSFNALELRNDHGSMFEGFFLHELLTDDHFSQNRINFWRTTNQTEIDFIHSTETETTAIEVKWDKETEPKSFQTIKKYYPEMNTRVVTRKNFTA